MRLLNLDSIDYSAVLKHIFKIPEVAVTCNDSLFKVEGVGDWLYDTPCFMKTFLRLYLVNHPVCLIGITSVENISYRQVCGD